MNGLDSSWMGFDFDGEVMISFITRCEPEKGTSRASHS